MTKELKQDELEKISGGDTHTDWKDTYFLYGLGYHIEVNKIKIFHQFTSHGYIRKAGYVYENGIYAPCYYIECDDNDDSGWYDEEDLQDTTHTSWDKIDPQKVTVVLTEK